MRRRWKVREQGVKRTRKRWFLWPLEFGLYMYWGRWTVVEEWNWDYDGELDSDPHWIILEIK